jgi:hypothetical protein
MQQWEYLKWTRKPNYHEIWPLSGIPDWLEKVLANTKMKPDEVDRTRITITGPIQTHASDRIFIFLGENGWELVAVQGDDLFFKRPKS